MTTLPRPRIDALLVDAWRRRVTLVVAGGGYGKTTALLGLANTGRVRRLGLRPVDRKVELLSARVAETLGLASVPGVAAPAAAIGADDRRALAEGQAAVLCEAVARRGEDVLLVVDDLEQLPDESAAGELLRAICLQAPAELHVVLSGRRHPGVGLGRTSRGEDMLEITALDLAFTLEETAELLAARLGAPDDALAERCWSLTGGWAAALQLLADRLRRVDPAQRLPMLARLPVLGSHLWRDFVGDLLAREGPEVRRVLAIAAIAPVVDEPVAAALGVLRPASTLDDMQSRGLLAATGDGNGRTMSPVLSEVVGETQAAEEAGALRHQIGRWLESEGRIGEALECLVGGPAADTRALVERCGHALVARGYGARVTEVLTAVGTAGSIGLDSILGEALQSFGEWDRAIEIFRRIQRAALAGRLAPAIAWRFGILLYLRGESASALEVLSAARVGEDAPADDALVSAWLSSILWSRGESGRSREMASTALRQAECSRDATALAAAHVSCALASASSGDREGNERHYRAALTAAAEAGDAIQIARIRANLSSRAVEEGDYALAIEEADRALSVGAGHKFFAALAMCNKAEALLHLGEFEDARAHLVEAIDVYSSLGSLMACAPHSMLGLLYRERGDLTRARISFERAERLAEEAGDAHTLVFARCGLARTLAEEDAVMARGYAKKAIAQASSLERAYALCAAAWVELCAGDREAAGRIAGEAEVEARGTGDRPALADALALQGIAATPPREDRLSAAAEVWKDLGDTIARQRAMLVLATCRGDMTAAATLRQALLARGVVPDLDPAARGASSAPDAPELAIITLGRFAVLRGGERIPPTAWQSRKARDLLKLLVSRRGRPIPRDAVAEALWPGEAAAPLANRLSVALSTLRKVLDPERSHPADYFVAAERQWLALRIDRVSIDVIEFLNVGDTELAMEAGGNRDVAEATLRDAEKLYTGDFLEEDLYEDWAVDCREAARSVALEVSRRLARAAAERGDDETASRHLRRLLERDPYDEEAWIALVGAQSRLRRYGEARRQHSIYSRRMAELNVTPIALAFAVDGEAKAL